MNSSYFLSSGDEIWLECLDFFPLFELDPLGPGEISCFDLDLRPLVLSNGELFRCSRIGFSPE